MKKISRYALINLIMFLLTLFVNFLGANGVLFNNTQKEVSDQFRTILTPAAYAFTIWIVIYGLFFISLLMLLVLKRNSKFATIGLKISPWFWLSSILNMAWIVLYSAKMISQSVICIGLLLLSLLIIILKLKNLPTSGLANIYPITFGIYGGWLMVASFVNLANYIVMISGGEILGINDIKYGILFLLLLVIVGVLFAIYSKNPSFILPYGHVAFAIRKELLEVNPNFPTNIFFIVGVVSVIVFAYVFIKNRFSFSKKISNLN